jgi:hypothetical protein
LTATIRPIDAEGHPSDAPRRNDIRNDIRNGNETATHCLICARAFALDPMPPGPHPRLPAERVQSPPPNSYARIPGVESTPPGMRAP